MIGTPERAGTNCAFDIAHTSQILLATRAGGQMIDGVICAHRTSLRKQHPTCRDRLCTRGVRLAELRKYGQDSLASARTAPWPTSQLRICIPMDTRKRAMMPVVVNSRIPLLSPLSFVL